MDTRPSIFLSYAHTDTQIANQIRSDLDLRGCRVWQDVKEILVGESISSSIETALNSASFVCLLLSKESILRPWIQREYRAALSIQLQNQGERPRILPILLEEVNLPPLLRDIRYADSRNGYVKGIALLFEAIGLSASPAPFVELVDKIRSQGEPVSLIERASKERDEHFSSNLWPRFEEEAKRLDHELAQHPSSRLVVVEPPQIQQFLESGDARTAILRAPPIAYEDSVDFLAHLDDVVVDYSLEGLVEFVRLLCNWWRPIVTRKLYIVPERFVADHDGSYPDGSPWRIEISFSEVIKHASRNS